MLVLFDNGTPPTVARFLIDRHMVTEARARGWEELENGELLVTTEESQLSARSDPPQNCHCSVGLGRWSLIRPHVAQVVSAVNAATPGSFAEVEIPYPPRPV
jgi:hypothetical protein